MKGKKILITGGTGQVGRPIAESLARDNEIWCAARFSSPALKKQLEEIGARTYMWELGSSTFHGLPADFDCVIHSAWNIYPVANDFEAAIESNVEGTALLMNHCKSVGAFLFISSLVVYRPQGNDQTIFKERGEGYGNDSPYIPTYSVSKVAGEGVVRSLARVFSLPTTIARLGMGYGTFGHGGLPVRTFAKILAGEPIYLSSRPQAVSVIHEDDIAADVEPLLKAAAVPATIVNWAGDELVGEREMYQYLGELAGIEPKLVVDDGKAIAFFAADPNLRKSLTGPSRIPWKVGILKTLRSRFPDHKFPPRPDFEPGLASPSNHD
jgi:nucleoside-diphosphate-sugar epimerase